MNANSSSNTQSSSTSPLVDSEYFRRNKIAIQIIAFSLGMQVFPSLALSYFFKDDLKLEPNQLSQFDAITSAIWIFKPLFGFMGDSFPIFGSRRKAYLILFSFLELSAWLLLSLPSVITEFWQVIIVQLVINTSSGFINVIGEAIMVEISNFKIKNQSQITHIESVSESLSRARAESDYDRNSGKSSVKNVSQYLSLTAFSMLVFSFLGGYLINFMSVRQIFLINCLFPMMPLFVGIFLVQEKPT